MNRQRRQEAIARRRALIDSHIQMLSSTTRVLPNIIRNRTGRAQVPKYTTPVEYVEKPVPLQLPTQQGQGASNDPLSNFVFKIDNSNSSEEVYVEVTNGNDEEGNTLKIDCAGEGRESDMVTGGVDVEFTDEIRRMLTGQGNGFMQSFQTVKTEDGTVMVVLEGNNFTENDSSQEDTIHFSSGEMPAGMFYQEVTNNNGVTPVKDETNEVMESEEAEEDSYMIVHTADGDVLVPSKLCSQVETETPPPQPPVSAGESIIQFIANESGAIEQLLSSSSKPKPASNKRTLPTTMVSRSTQNVTKKPKPAPKIPANVTTSSKFRVNSSTSYSLSKNHQKTIPMSKGESIPAAKSKLKQVPEEKPKPFRFELPEMEDFDNFNNFMPCSVPVPIMIDSLRSESRPSKPTKVVNPKVASNSEGSIEKSVKMYTNGSEKSTSQKSPVPEKVPENGILLENVLKTQQKEIDHVTSELPSETQDSSQNCDSFNSFIQCGKCMELFSNESTFLSHLKSCVDNQNSQEIQHSSLIDITTCLEKGENIFFKSVTETTSSISSPVIGTSSSVEVHLISSPGQEQLSNNVENQNVVHFTEENLETRTNSLSTSGALCNEFVTYTNESQDETGNSQNLIENSACKYQENVDIGRRTLNKASAKANMAKELVEETEVWDGDSTYSNDKISVDVDKHTDGNGNTITIQSARIRSRNDRIKALDENATNEEEMLNNFRNIYEQVVKQSVTLN